MLKAIFFDATDTLFHLTGSVGTHYARVGEIVGLRLDASACDRAFVRAFKETPLRPATGEPREDDDKPWWRELVNRMFDEVSPATDPLDRDNFFEVAYEHFAEAGVWQLYAEVPEVLEKLNPRYDLAVVSNFDGRLRMILEQLAITNYFRHVFISSELGADKPDPLIFRRALEIGGYAPDEVLHVGDDPVRDWQAAAEAGLRVFRLRRPENTLRDVLTACDAF